MRKKEFKEAMVSIGDGIEIPFVFQQIQFFL